MEVEGFRSFKAQTLIEFTQGAGLKFVSGNNKLEPRLGANGAGKSTIWDALSFCLFGSSVKGLRASDLLSWGAKKIRVQIALEIDNEVTLIERHGLPDKITIDDQPVDQQALDRVIGLSKERFPHSVIFGQASPLFIDLPGPQRGVLLDAVLDLDVWLRSSETASRRFAALVKEGEDIARKASFLQGKIEGLPSLDEIDASIKAWADEQEKVVDSAIINVEAAEKELNKYQIKVRSTSAAVDELPATDRMLSQIRIQQTAKAGREAQYREMFRQLQDCQKQIDFYEDHDNCPECMQRIPGTHKRDRITDLRVKILDINLQIKSNTSQQHVIDHTLNDLENEYATISRKREFLVEQRATAAAEYKAHQALIKRLTEQASSLMEAKNPFSTKKDQAQADRDEINAELKEVEREGRQINAQSIRMSFWRDAFKRVRLFMVKRILAQLEIETASAAAVLGLIGWTIAFNTEVETKSGTTRPGIHILVASPDNKPAPWEAYSGGERQRVRIAVALGLASMIQRMAGVNYLFEVWDEPTASLGSEGLEDLLDCLKHRAETLKKSIWLCDHSALIYSGFSEIWQARKDKAGSSVYLMSSSGG